MGTATVEFTVFTKFSKAPLPEMGRLIKGLGFDGVELTVRPGFQVEPEAIDKSLPEAARVLGDCGLKIGSITGPIERTPNGPATVHPDEKTIAACAEAGVGIIRICEYIPRNKDYLSAVADYQRVYDALVPILDRYGVALGLQNHCDRSIAGAMQLRHAIGQYDPKHVCAVWDPAHNALQGEQTDLAADIIWPHVRLVNLKNGFYRRTNGPEAEAAQWKHFWTTGRHGRADWPKVADELKKRGYRGDVCLSAEYSDMESVERLIAEDIAFAKSLF